MEQFDHAGEVIECTNRRSVDVADDAPDDVTDGIVRPPPPANDERSGSARFDLPLWFGRIFIVHGSDLGARDSVSDVLSHDPILRGSSHHHRRVIPRIYGRRLSSRMASILAT